MSAWQSLKRAYRTMRYAVVTLRRFDSVLNNMDTRNVHSLEQNLRLNNGRKLIDFIKTGEGFHNDCQ